MIQIKEKYKKALKFYVKQFGFYKKLWIPGLILRILTSLIGLVPAFYYKEVLDIIYNSVGKDRSVLFSQILTLLFIILGINIARLTTRRLQDLFAFNFFIKMRKKLYDQAYPYLLEHSYSFFTDNMVGSLVSKLNKYIWAFERVLSSIFFRIIPILILIFGSTIVIAFYSPIVAIVILAWFVIYLVSQILLYRWWYPLSVKVNKLQSKLSGRVADSIGNYYNIKIFASLKREYEQLSEKIDHWLDKDLERWLKAMLIWTTGGILTIGLEFIVFYILLKQWSLNIVSIGVFAMVQSYIVKIISKAHSIGHVIRNLTRASSRTAEMVEILHTQHDIQNIKGAQKLRVQDGSIKFQDVTFGYNEKEKVFDKLNLNIKSGEKLAFVGKSGAGKSSLIKLLFRLYDIDDGRIMIDNQNIAKVTKESLRSNISMVPQKPILFHRSVKENIKYGAPNVSDDQVKKAAKKARCHEFIQNLENGYDTLVGERGVKLSGGEKQRVAIARAILEDRDILALDEATSSLDSEAEKQIQAAMEDAMEGKTSIVIAHRLSTIMKMDRIVVLDDGQIEQIGTHDELINKESGIYKKLWELQSGGFVD